MPNWCWNHLEVTGDEKQLQEFVEKSLVKDEHSLIESRLEHDNFSFQGTHPMPKELEETTSPSDKPNWYDWRCDNWGTKWDACESYINQNDIDFFSVTFDTAWSPPVKWINYIMKDFPDLRFSLEYDEPGCAFGGHLQAQYKLIWEDNIWDLESASECCQGPINWEHEELEQQCLICGEETETISINVADIKPAKIKL